MSKQSEDLASSSTQPTGEVSASGSTRDGYLANPRRTQVTSDEASTTPEGSQPATSER